MFSAVWQNAKDFDPELGLDFCFSPVYFEKEKQNKIKTNKNNPSLSFPIYTTKEWDTWLLWIHSVSPIVKSLISIEK